MAPEKRKELVARRKVEFAAKYPGDPDFAPHTGYCWSCGADLVELEGDNWPTAFVTGCWKCHRSYCD